MTGRKLTADELYEILIGFYSDETVNCAGINCKNCKLDNVCDFLIDVVDKLISESQKESE